VQQLISELVEFSFPARWVGSESYQLHPEAHYAGPRSKEELARILGGFVRNVINDLLIQTEKSFFVEDNTWNILFAREILDLVPEAKIVHVCRDPRDVVASFSHQRWSPKDKEQGAQWYRAMMNHWFAVRSTLPTDSYIEIKLEDAVTAPQTTVRAVCEFTEIAFDPVMLETDLTRSNTGRWRTEFSPAEKEKVMAVLGDIIMSLGYDGAHESP
jgi:hypothetical protein